MDREAERPGVALYAMRRKAMRRPAERREADRLVVAAE